MAVQGPDGFLYYVSALNSVVETNNPYVGFFLPSACTVLDEGLGPIEASMSLSEDDANACIGTVAASCASLPCGEGTCVPNSLGGHSCVCPPDTTGPNCELVPAVCPDGLSYENGQWQTGRGQLNAFPTVRVTATFRNDTSNTFVFDSSTLPTVSVLPAIFPAVSHLVSPQSDVGPGGELSYDFVVYTAQMPDGAHNIALSLVEAGLYGGDLPPANAALVSVSIDCSGLPH
jgi:hypothetical protein